MMQEKTNTTVTNTLDFLGPQGPLVLPLIGPPVHVQEFLLLFILLVVVVTGLWQISHVGATLLQMIIRRGQPFANDHLEGPASCK